MGKRKSDEVKLKNVALEDQLAADAAPRQRDRKKPKLPSTEQSEDLSVITLGKKDMLMASKINSDSESESEEKVVSQTYTRKTNMLAAPASDSDDDLEDIGQGEDDDRRSHVAFDYDDNADELFDELQISSQDAEILNSLGDVSTKTSLAEAMRKKFELKLNEALKGDGSEKTSLDPRIVKLYRGVGEVLSKYRSNRLPKAFKIVPSLSNWETVLWIMEPDRWTAAAVYEGTRLFASNLNEKMAQRFYNLVLLPRLRDDVAEYKKLSPHLYQALMKAVFKPAAFFKGILIPLCEDPECTLREAVVFGSALAKISIPMLHSAAAMLRLLQIPGYNGPTMIILHILLKKKYTLPYRVIDELVSYFTRFGDADADEDESIPESLPVLWHQCLLSFVSHYARDTSPSQRAALMSLIKRRNHASITSEIRSILTTTPVTRDDESVNKGGVSLPNSRTVSVSMD